MPAIARSCCGDDWLVKSLATAARWHLRAAHLPPGPLSRYCHCDHPLAAAAGEAPMDKQVKYLLDESELPRQWYNVIPDLPAPPPPPLHPGTGQPVGPDDLAPLFPMALIAQEVSPD